MGDNWLRNFGEIEPPPPKRKRRGWFGGVAALLYIGLIAVGLYAIFTLWK